MMRTALASILALALAACSSGTQESDTQAASEEWREVPLAEDVYREQPTPTAFRQDTIMIDVLPGPGLELKLRMKQGDSFVYSWRAEGLEEPEDLLSEFHGHTDREPGEQGTVMYYKKATGGSDRGSLVAPFDGIHGWYLRNDSYTPIAVHLDVAGFYERTE